MIRGMRLRHGLGIVGCLLAAALAFSPTNSPASDSQSGGLQPTNQAPVKPSAVAAAASASKQTRQSAPPSKVIRNHDLNDGNGPTVPAQSGHGMAVAVDRDKATQEEGRRVQQFESQGKTFQNQVRVQKGKIVDLQNQIRTLNDQFNAWGVSHRHVDSNICWTSLHDDEYYKSWCDVGRNLKDARDTSQSQLASEKAKLDQMQENIRRAGYGNAVYDPD